MKNQKGFSILNFCFLVPIIFTGSVLAAGSYQLISKYTDAQRECRTHVMKAQQILGAKLKELLDLNPKAKALRVKERALRIALAANPLPPVAAALVLQLNYNLLQQSILRGRQEMIIASAKFEAQKEMSDLPSKVSGVKYSRVGLKIYKSPPNAIAPDHLTLPLFTEVQTLKANWKVPITEFVPEIILDVFKNYPSTVEGKCAATLVKRGNVWNPKLHLARF